MVSEGIVIPNCRNNIEGTSDGDIDRLVPSGIQIPHDDSSLGQAFLILISQDHVGIASAIRVTGFQVFGLDDLDCKDILVRPFDLLPRPVGFLHHSSASVNIH